MGTGKYVTAGQKNNISNHTYYVVLHSAFYREFFIIAYLDGQHAFNSVAYDRRHGFGRLKPSRFTFTSSKRPGAISVLTTTFTGWSFG
jgi:hypothetical protein